MTPPIFPHHGCGPDEHWRMIARRAPDAETGTNTEDTTAQSTNVETESENNSHYSSESSHGIGLVLGHFSEESDGEEEPFRFSAASHETARPNHISANLLFRDQVTSAGLSDPGSGSGLATAGSENATQEEYQQPARPLAFYQDPLFWRQHSLWQQQQIQQQLQHQQQQLQEEMQNQQLSHQLQEEQHQQLDLWLQQQPWQPAQGLGSSYLHGTAWANESEGEPFHTVAQQGNPQHSYWSIRDSDET